MCEEKMCGGKKSEKKIPVINEEECTGCEVCVDECPNSALELNKDEIAFLARPEDCDGEEECGTCSEVCPMEAITYE